MINENSVPRPHLRYIPSVPRKLDAPHRPKDKSLRSEMIEILQSTGSPLRPKNIAKLISAKWYNGEDPPKEQWKKILLTVSRVLHANPHVFTQDYDTGNWSLIQRGTTDAKRPAEESRISFQIPGKETPESSPGS